MSIPEVTEASQLADQSIGDAWFVTYNRFYLGPSSTKQHQLQPFPDREFCGHSPWEDHVVIAHYGVEPYAHAAGFMCAEDYLLSRIATAPKRGAFCAQCPTKSCPDRVYYPL